MYIHIGFIKNQLRLRKHLPTMQEDVGSILKHHRKEMGLTLEEGALGICSVSYLSKVENNLIYPSDKYIALFEEKFKVELKDKPYRTDEDIADEIIIKHFYDEAIEVDLKFFSGLDYKSKLNQLLYLTITNQIERAKKQYMELMPYIKNLNTKELKIFLYSISCILTSEGRLKDAFCVLNMDTPYPMDSYLGCLMMKSRIILATKMNNHPFILLNYEQVVSYLIDHEYYHVAHDLKYHYIVYLVQFITYENLVIMLDKSLHLKEEQKKYVLARYYFLNGAYEDAYPIIQGLELYDISFYNLSIQILNKINDKETLKKLITHQKYKDNIQMNLMSSYLNEKHFSRRLTTTNFIKNQIMKINDLPDMIDQLHFWYEESLENFKAHGFYKDATHMGHLIYRKIRDLSTTEY